MGYGVSARKVSEINYSLSGKPWLEPVHTSVLGIPEQVNDIDPDYFVVRNTMTKQFEIHSLGNKDGDTVCIHLPFRKLDGRTVDMVRRNNLKTRGRAVFDEIDAANKKMMDDKDKQFKDDVNAIARDTKSVFAKHAWGNM